MPFSSDQLVSWSDIESLFNDINAARRKFEMSNMRGTPTPGGRGQVTQPAVVSQLKRGITDLRNNAYVGAEANLNITVPRANDLLAADVLRTIRTRTDYIRSDNVCRHDAAHRGFSRCSHFGNDGHRSSHRDHRANDSHRATDYAFSANRSFHYNGFTWKDRRAN